MIYFYDYFCYYNTLAQTKTPRPQPPKKIRLIGPGGTVLRRPIGHLSNQIKSVFLN